MARLSAIEWTDSTWNPVRGCSKVSPGCKHCYAEVFAERWRGVPGHPYEMGFDLRVVPERLSDPVAWRAPRRVFVNSMSDLFHEQIPESYIESVFEIMAMTSWHTFQVLTKRSSRMRMILNRMPSSLASLPNVWLGVSVEDRAHGIERVTDLRETPARVRFLSIEPLLEDLGTLDLSEIEWVIVGGESGRNARPMMPEWVRDIRDQCKRSHTRFFFKQWGGVNKGRAGRSLDGRTHDEVPPGSSPLITKERRHAIAIAVRQIQNRWLSDRAVNVVKIEPLSMQKTVRAW